MRRISLLLLSFLVLACSATAPGETPTVSPTSTQTVMPLPTQTMMVSATPPPSTAIISPACLNTPTPYTPSDKSMLGIWRVRHDVERTNWNCRARLWAPDWKKLRGLPETVRINGGRGSVNLPDDWVKFLDRINTTDGQRYLRKLQNGWVNYGPFPKVEQLTFGGNLVEVTRIRGNRAYIKSFSLSNPPPDASAEINSLPNTLIQTFSVVYTDGSWEMSTPVGVVYTFIIANPDEELWIDINNLVR